MIYIFLIGLLLIIILDLRIFLRVDRQAVINGFKISSRVITPLSIILFLLILFSPHRGESAAFFFLIFILPLYILRRHQIKKVLLQENVPPEEARLPQTKDFFTLRLMSDGLGVAILWIYCTAMLSVTLKGINYVSPGALSTFAELIISALLSWVFIVILIYKPASNFSRRGFAANVGLRKKGRPFYKVFIIPALAGIVFALISAGIISTREVQPDTPLNEIISSSDSLGLGVIFVMMAVLMAPLIEEIVFRGYYFHIISRYKSRTFAFYFVALTFAFLHVGQYWSDWPAILMVTILGFVLTWLRVWADSTLASVVMHYFYNGCVVIFPVLFLLVKNPAYLEYRTNYYSNSPRENIELLEKSLIFNPDLAEAYNDLAWIYAENDLQLEKALELIEKALSYDPQNVSFLDTKAQVLTKLGRIKEAVVIRENLLDRKLSEEMRIYQNKELDKLYEVY